MSVYAIQLIPLGGAIFDHRAIILSILVEQNRNEHHLITEGVDCMVLQNYGCFTKCHLRHELCSFECRKQTPLNEKNIEVLLNYLNSLWCKYKLNSGVFNS